MRFKENAIVRHLLDNGGIDLNQLARLDFSREDREQFAQLIGYSLSGFGELGYVRDTTYAAAQQMYEDPELDGKDARIADLESKLSALQELLRAPMAMLYGMHPDDFQGTA
ncbi:hypothetical protein D3C85_1492550 [compost metagenome]